MLKAIGRAQCVRGNHSGPMFSAMQSTKLREGRGVVVRDAAKSVCREPKLTLTS